ncbi:hypothetical protein HanHA300_Chr06g0221921 [Helianthus annuus]|nr:hypothetical protein HanHA300_Chr06g0221921 [Helianthus annuus]
MISDHSPSDPSSSHHQQQQKSHHLKVSDIDLKSTVAHLHDSNNPLPYFSIRDYVFSLRNKEDISCNWPFTSTSLQLCLKHGVKNLLPPFQSLDSLRNNSSLGRCNPKDCLTNQQLVNGFHDKPTNDQSRSNKEIVSSNSSGSKRGKESHFQKQQHSGQTKSKDKPPPAASQKPENASVNTTMMTSKVCPVCKIFSSSSNTTLNAHIDQCLTGEGTMKWTESPKVLVKHKVKPRKMRLMLDIYKTASHCTVEELDRRNGTSWATNSSFPAQECQFQEEEEEPRLTKVNPVVADNEGDVYIDTNGTKVRVLSVPKTGLSDNHGGRKSLIMSKKKNSLYKKKHHKKYLQLSPNAGKLCLPKAWERTGRREEVIAEHCSKDERSRENTRVVDLGIIRPPWACSKRTGVSKKLNGGDRKVDLRSQRRKDLVVKNHEKSFAGCDLASSQNRTKVGTSLSLVKQPINRTAERRKEDTHVDYDDDIDNDDDSSQSRHSDDDTRSKRSKFPSLRKNALFPAVKFCFKRKFSAVDESRVKSVDGLSQDSSKEQCGTEEDESTKKKQEAKSITSKSTSNEESLVEIRTVNRNEQDSVRNVKSSSIPAQSFMSLSTSFDPEFPTDECFELICSTNHTLNDADKQEKYFQEVDPIPIPGPPGSFLPASPGGETVSEMQVQPTKFHSLENQHHHHDTVDQDSMSDSPVSTVSNSRSSCGKDDTYKNPLLNGETGFTESGQSHKSFRNDQPCCCSRKEAALNYQDLYILRKQPVETASLNSESQMFSVNNYPNSSADTACPSKPVLRLMGKNLTIVKTDEDEFKLPQPSQHPQRPVSFSQYQNEFESQHFNVHPTRSHVDFRPIHLGPTRSHYVHNGLDTQAVNGRNFYSAASSSRPVKETIIIDNSLENDDDNTIRNRFSKGNQGQMKQLYSMYPSNGDGSLVFRSGSFRTSSANRGAGGKWNIGSSTTYYPPTYP